MDFEITILGATAATPIYGRGQTAQLINHNQHYFLIDCGEGTQHQFLRYKKKMNRIEAIFISHLHGDHYFGLMGVLNTLHLQKRSEPLRLFGPAGLSEIIIVHFRHSNTVLGYPLVFKETSTQTPALIWENEHLTVETIPLRHSLPCAGFLLREKKGRRKLIQERLLPDFTPSEYIDLKHQRDIIRNGKAIPYDYFSYEVKPRSYAFCSDTAYHEAMLEQINGVDCLYHEATFIDADAFQASETKHSTALQAATIAQQAKVNQLLLGHFSIRYKDPIELLLEAKKVFANSFIAEEGHTFSIQEEGPRL
jgi:ribonuclease Z